jgi:hypothetical protein
MDKKRRDFGPGFYLYLGTRRGWRFYPEHLFVNLIWGLEALHRKKQSNDLGSKAKDRVARIVNLIDNDKDKKWLTKILINVHEPNLEQRLLEIMELVSINIDKAKLRQFGSRCAQIWNDISHFGEQRDGLPYDHFIKEVTYKARALSTLYHMIISMKLELIKKPSAIGSTFGRLAQGRLSSRVGFSISKPLRRANAERADRVVQHREGLTPGFSSRHGCNRLSSTKDMNGWTRLSPARNKSRAAPARERSRSSRR